MLRNLLTGLGATALAVGTLVPTATAGAHPVYHPYGSVRAPDQVLLDGCHRYRFHYTITVPSDQWTAEFFLINPHHHRLASSVIDAATEPRRDTRRWSTPICRHSTSPGTYRLKMKVTYDVAPSYRDQKEGYVRPATFRLTTR